MKAILLKVMLSLLLLSLVPTSLISADGPIVGVNAGQLDPFHQAMLQAVQTQEMRVKNLTAQATNRSNAPMSIDKVALGNAIIMLDVKRTLVSNFWNNPVTQNTGFQNRLIQILNKDMIVESDLAELQNAADFIRSTMQSSGQPVAQPTQPSPILTPSSPGQPIQQSQFAQPAQPTPTPTTAPTQTSPPLPIVLPPSPQPGVIPASG